MAKTLYSPVGELIERQPLHVFTEQAYLDYSMYVILDRALPHVADGLKPVQRRIVYAMSELGLNAGSKFKKSARTVGDVLGKFHPHGDSACYEAMVLLSQPFSLRYPLIEGQGNWGSIDDPKSFAAMRYTEARLAKFTDSLLTELAQGTVDWRPNFDGTLNEPTLLPARLPTILLNGSSGIAVGMATDIPPHNLREISGAAVHLLAHPEATIEDLCQFVQAPDYPTDAEIITPIADIRKMYATGGGSLRQRAVWYRENGEIIVTALPHQTSGSKLLINIAAQMQAKKLPMLEDLRDESDHENPVRLVIVPKNKRIDADDLMKHLFATTDLERSYRINLNMIGLDGKPQLKNLKMILAEWLVYRQRTVERRLQYRLDKVTQRMHLLEGWLIAFLNLDEIIKIIRIKDKPKPLLKARFQLTDKQVDAVLDLKLRQLAGLEENKIKTEQDALAEERDYLENILTSDQELKALIRQELLSDTQEYGDARRSPLIERAQAQALEQTDLTPASPVSVILSQKGWVRAGKGHELEAENLNYRAGDGFLSVVRGMSNQLVVFLDDHGRSYSLPADSFPSARSQGEALAGRISPPDGAQIAIVLMDKPDSLWLLSSNTGYGFICRLDDLHSKNKAGKRILNLSKDAKIMSPVRIQNVKSAHVALSNSSGHLLVIPLADIPQMTKGKGVKLLTVHLAKEESLVAISVLESNATLRVISGKRHISILPQDIEIYQGGRNQRGCKLPKGFQRVDALEVVS